MTESLLTKNELISSVNGIQLGAADCYFVDVQTDSRNVCAEKPCLFVPLVGEFQNGHKYIPEVLKKSPGAVLLNKKEYESNSDFYNKLVKENPSVCFVQVENTLHGLQDAAEAYVAKFPELLKICITGSSGKTTTKEITVSVFKEHFGENAVVYTKGNFNSETGLPLSVFGIRKDHKVGIFEMGMNRENEIGEISKVLKAKYGLITNIGTAHIGILGSREKIAEEKRKAFDYIPADGCAFIPDTDDFADFCTEKVAGKVVKFGKTVPESENGVKFLADEGLDGTSFELNGVKITMPLVGEYNYQNALGVIALALETGISVEEIKSGIEKMAAVSGRMEVQTFKMKSGVNTKVISDCYNANPDSMGKVIDFCQKLTTAGSLIFVLGDMKELGEKSFDAHKKIGLLLKEIVQESPSKVGMIVLVGEEMSAAYKELNTLYSAEDKQKNKILYFENNSVESFNSIAEAIITNAKENDLIVLKASHSLGLEKLLPMLGTAKTISEGGV